jgi:agmatinase
VCRRGIATLPPVVGPTDPAELAVAVERVIGGLFDRGVFPVTLGGEHSVSIGAFRAAAARFPKLSILQVDAHADTREEYHGSPCNHACVMARGRELCPIVQVGIRAIDADEFPRLDPERVVYAHQIAADPTGRWMERVLAGLSDDVYLTVDLDGFDPAHVPATGTPEPGGIGWYHAIHLFEKVVATRRVVGFDVVELLPTPGQWASEFFAAKLVYRMLSLVFAGRPA